MSKKICLELTARKKKKVFLLRKFVKRTGKIIFSLAFICFRFTEISNFLDFPSNENVRNQYISSKAYSCVNMKVLYAKTVCKDEMIFCRIVMKTSNFSLMFTIG